MIADGLRISHEDTYSVDLVTMQILLRTSKALKQETMRQLFKQPLHLILTTKKSGRCRVAGGLHALQ